MLRKKKKQKAPKHRLQVVAEYMQSLLAAVLLAVLIRGFVFEPFKIPSESMVPTLLVGDHIFVARYKYGLRIPFTKVWIKEFSGPQRGDVVVFSYPEDEDVDFIKRVVGIPGDAIAMKSGILYINGQPVREDIVRPVGQSDSNKCVMELDSLSQGIFPENLNGFPYYLKYKKFHQIIEKFDGGSEHLIQKSRENPSEIEFEITVPPRFYFVMGDNRDQSHDSRLWGLVPRDNLKGKAKFIWLSLNHERTACPGNVWDPYIFPHVRWDRFGREII